MPTSWEIAEQNCVLTGILHVDSTCMAWSLGLRNLILPGPIMPVAGMPFDHGRNAMCQTAIEGGFKYLFMLDSDVIPPRDAVLRLMSRNLPIVSGLYCRRSPPHGVPVAQKGGQWVTQFAHGSCFEVDVVGAGCLLIRRDVLEAVAKNPQRPGHVWFDWRVNYQGLRPREECMSEDFTFNLHAKKLGFPTYLDTSVVCRHVGLASATYASFVPCEATPHT